MQERACRRYARIVDEPGEGRIGEPFADIAGCVGDALRVGDVEDERGQFVADLLDQAVGVVHAAHACEDMKALARQKLCDRIAYAGRGACHDDGSFHCRCLQGICACENKAGAMASAGQTCVQRR